MNTSTPKKDQTQQHTDKAREAAGQAVDRTREGLSQAASAAREGLAGAASSAREAAGHVGEALSGAASTAASSVGHGAQQAVSATGRGLENLADTVRDRGPDSGMLGTATRAVADTLDSTGHYFEGRNLNGMVDDVTGVIKRNPIPAVLIGLGVGFLLGRTLRS
jgi:hypothetical protein